METGNNCFIVEPTILESQSAAPSTGLFVKLALGAYKARRNFTCHVEPAPSARASPNSQKSYFLLETNCPSLTRGTARATQR